MPEAGTAMSHFITTKSTIRRNEEIDQAEIDREIVMMSIDTGEYYGLNSVASRIWEIIEKPLRTGDICDRLVREYQVTDEVCQKDVIDFLNHMAKSNIIFVSD